MRVLWLLLIGMTVASCYKAKTPATSETNIPSPLTSESIFPHKADWGKIEEHGVYVKTQLAGDPTSCGICHKTPADTGGAPSCWSCHAKYPHKAPGMGLGEHGAMFLKEGRAACATACHGTDLQGGFSNIACTRCHAAYPHPDGWKSPAMHGLKALGDDKLACAGCHGSDWTGGKSGVSCLGCHNGLYPHAAGWADPAQHGKLAVDNGKDQCATACHGTLLDGGYSDVSCSEGCHKLWPHPKEWLPNLHGEKERALGLSACTSCHKLDPPGGKTGVTCTQCHASLLDHQSDDWGKAGHGKAALTGDAMTAKDGCPLCHGATLEGGKEPATPGLKTAPACNACHESFPQKHQLSGWKTTFDGHGKYVADSAKAEGKAMSESALAECSLCHGETLTGGSVGKTCYNSQCHSTFPHPIPASIGGADFAPWLKGHGSYYSLKEKSLAKATCATKNCHGINLGGNPENVPVQDKLVKGCKDCHLAYPHPAPLAGKATWDHGNAAVGAADFIAKCGACHANKETGEMTGSGNAPSCYQCHQNYPDKHLIEKWTSTKAGHGDYVMGKVTDPTKSVKTAGAGECTICHGTSLQGGSSGKSCYSCHLSFPHAPLGFKAKIGGSWQNMSFLDASWGQFKNGHGQYVVGRRALANDGKAPADKITVAQQVQNECAKSCHGADLTTIINNKNCLTCHPSYPHKMPEWAEAATAAGKSHGESVIESAMAESTGIALWARKTCASGYCHGTVATQWEGKKCNYCHATFPDSHLISDWAVPSAPGVNPKHASADKSGCWICHGILGMNPGATKPCTDCHDANGVYPLHNNAAAKWYDPEAGKLGGEHGIYVLKNKGAALAGCLGACHGPTGDGGLSGKDYACHACHAIYPHAADWLGPTGAGFSKHGLAVLDNPGNVPMEDDFWNDAAKDDLSEATEVQLSMAKFAVCKTCHGDIVKYPINEWPLSQAGTEYSPAEGASVIRCTKCHTYPHQSLLDNNGKERTWGPTENKHAMGIYSWESKQAKDVELFVKETCAGTVAADGTYTAGCHMSGPKATNLPAGIGDAPECTYCHKP